MTLRHHLRAPALATPPRTGHLPFADAPNGRDASVPAETYFDTVAAEYRVDVPEDLPAGSVLRLAWTGDVGRAYVGATLVADQFFTGRVWEIGRLPAGAALRVRVLPLHADAEVHVPDGAGEAARTAAVTRAEWVTGRTWAVRSG